MTPPVQTDLLGLVDRAHEQPNLDREQLDVREVDLDVAGNHEPLVEHPIEDVDETVAASGSDEVCQSECSVRRGTALAYSAEWPEIDLQLVIRKTEHRLQFPKASIEGEQRQPKPFDLFVAQRASVHSSDRLMLKDLTKHLDDGQDKLCQSLLDALRRRIDPLRKRTGDGA